MKTYNVFIDAGKSNLTDDQIIQKIRESLEMNSISMKITIERDKVYEVTRHVQTGDKIPRYNTDSWETPQTGSYCIGVSAVAFRHQQKPKKFGFESGKNFV